MVCSKPGMVINMKSITNLPITDNRAWLILGKGPTFERLIDINTNSYYLFGLNDTVNYVYCTIGHFIDLDVILRLKGYDCEYLVVPWHPHVNNSPTNRTLKDWIKENKYLEHYENNGRLFTYNLSTWKQDHLEGYPVIKTRYFSAEAAFRILILKKIKTIYSLGIDGGIEYAREFKRLNPLTNGRKSFDDQFKEINKIVEESLVTYHAL